MLSGAIMQWVLCLNVLIAAIVLGYQPIDLGKYARRLYVFAVLLFVHATYFLFVDDLYLGPADLCSLLAHGMHNLVILRFYTNPLQRLEELTSVAKHTFMLWLFYFCSIEGCRGLVHIDALVSALLVVAMYLVSQKSIVVLYPVVGGGDRIHSAAR